MKDISKFSKVQMVTPTTDPQDGGFDTFLNYVCTRDPTTDEPLLPYHGYQWLPFWWQTATSEDGFSTYTTTGFSLCVDNTAEAMVWWKMVFDTNILSILNNQGWGLNTSRAYSTVSSPAFNTSYQPSATNDTLVTVSISLTSTLILASTVDIQVDTGSGFQTINQVSISGLAATTTQSVTFLVPSSAHYKLIQASGTSSIVSINTITL